MITKEIYFANKIWCLSIWILLCYLHVLYLAGNYTPVDLNMPKQIPKRASNQWDYAKDAPLTCLGKFQAFVTGNLIINILIPYPPLDTIQAVGCRSRCLPWQSRDHGLKFYIHATTMFHNTPVLVGSLKWTEVWLI